jgi:hypothetical protein
MVRGVPNRTDLGGERERPQRQGAARKIESVGRPFQPPDRTMSETRSGARVSFMSTTGASPRISPGGPGRGLPRRRKERGQRPSSAPVRPEGAILLRARRHPSGFMASPGLMTTIPFLEGRALRCGRRRRAQDDRGLASRPWARTAPSRRAVAGGHPRPAHQAKAARGAAAAAGQAVRMRRSFRAKAGPPTGHWRGRILGKVTGREPDPSGPRLRSGPRHRHRA